jgi:hypothetical protein
VIVIVELTGDYTIILPLMATISLVTGMSSLLSRDTIYTLKLRRRGIDLLRGGQPNGTAHRRRRDAIPAARAGPRCGGQRSENALEVIAGTLARAVPTLVPG